jgi:hypothetical protein
LITGFIALNYWEEILKRRCLIRRGRKMSGNLMDRCVGKYCKIVTKEPGEEKASVVTGVVKEIDHDGEFIIVKSKEGTGLLSIKSIIAIKPRKKES